MARVRLDVLLTQRGLAETRELAQALILDQAVLVDEQPMTRPGALVAQDVEVQVKDRGPTYVGRGALKLIEALDRWHIDPSGDVALDVGASTGGFTEVLLERGAARVYAVDVGRGQLHARLRADERVVNMERTNIRYLGALPELADLAVIDVSFISLKLVLPRTFALITETALVVALIKPQFEAGRELVRKGVVRDARVHQQVIDDLRSWSSSQARQLIDTCPSPIRGHAGNTEFLSLWAC